MSAPEGAISGLLLVGAVGPDGIRIDLECREGRIVARHEGGLAGGARGGARSPLRRVDLTGMTLLPALSEPHAHIDKAYTADRYPNRSGDLAGAKVASELGFREMGMEEIAQNARRALRTYRARGCLSVRTHVTVDSVTALRAVGGVLMAAGELADTLDVQVVAHVSSPISGKAGREHRALLREAIEMGATHVGGAPCNADDPAIEMRTCIEEAAMAELPLDLHLDETLDPTSLSVVDLADAVTTSGFPLSVAASHCVSLGILDQAAQRRAAERLARAGVAVITLPQTNLYLQGRDQPVATPRGMTALSALRAAGVLVAAGGDNVQDPFNPMGRGDPLETAGLLVTAGHLGVETAFDAVTSDARAVMGLEAVDLRVGCQADLVAVAGSGLREAVAEADQRRLVIRRGAMLDVPPAVGGSDPAVPWP